MQQHISMKYKFIYLGVLLSVALILSYIEMLIGLNPGVPGFKIGLANFSILACLYFFNFKDTLILTISKSLLCSILFGSMSSFMYSISGALLSFIIMFVLTQMKIFSIPTVSAVGGVFHNIGQLLMAYIILGSKGIFYYMPVLIIIGLVTGTILGLAFLMIKPYLHRIIHRSDTI